MTYLEAIITVLEDAGEPLNYGEIARRALERGLIPKTKSTESNVSKIITTHMDPPNQVFVKISRGIYALSQDRPGPTPNPPEGENRQHRDYASQSIEEMAPSTEYSEYLYATKYGTLVTGTINDRTTFMFCEKNRKLLTFGLKGKEVSSALYALLDLETNHVYVGITRRGSKRITDHWGKKFTHVAILFGTVAWSAELRTKLERDLTDFFRLLRWKPTNKVETITLVPRDMRTREELLPAIRQIAARIHSLIHNMDSLYSDHISLKPNGRGKGASKPKPPIYPVTKHSWIWPCSKGSYQIAQRDGIWASKAALEKIAARVRPGHLVTFYVREHRAFSGVYEFVGQWYPAPRTVWPGEAESGRILYPSQIRIKQIRDGRAELDAMTSRLEIFLTNASGNAGHVLQSPSGYPGNHGRPIPDSDMQIISDSMRPVGAGRG